MQQQLVEKQQERKSPFTQELEQILALLDNIENHTAQLRNKIMAELKESSESKN